MTYAEKLKDPRWQRKRLQVLERDGFSCCLCGDKTTELHVHHRSYSKGKNPWDYDDSWLVTLCKECHENVERINLAMLLSSTQSPTQFAALESVIRCFSLGLGPQVYDVLCAILHTHQKGVLFCKECNHSED